MTSQINELGRRFASWAQAHNYPPANYHGIGRGWKIGPLYPGSGGAYVSDPGPGEAMRMMRGPANWYVLANGSVTTDDSLGSSVVGSQPDTSRFVRVVLANWGCDLNSGPLSEPSFGPQSVLDLGYGSPGWDTVGIRTSGQIRLGPLDPARQTPRRHQSWWRRFLDFLEDMGI